MSSGRRLHPPDSAARRRSVLAAGALLFALLAAQALGLWHRTAHAPQPGLATAATAHIGAAPHAHFDGHDEAHAAEHVFGHAAGDAPQCRLYDQLAIGDWLLATVVALPVFEPPRTSVAAIGCRLARHEPAPYQARAPPAFG